MYARNFVSTHHKRVVDVFRWPRRRRRGRKTKTAESLLGHLGQRSVAWKRGDLCNPPSKIVLAKEDWGREHFHHAGGPHWCRRVYEGEEKETGLEMTVSKPDRFLWTRRRFARGIVLSGGPWGQSDKS